jgi:6-phosphofructokinase 1
VVQGATNLDWEVIGFRDGFEGLLPDGGDYLVLTLANTAGIMRLGGTMLGTTSKGHFIAKVGDGTNRQRVAPAVLEQTRRNLAALGVDALICIGGDGSLTTAEQLHQAGIPVIGVPKTIDNDLDATATTFGFDSAVACVADALDRLHTTASSHKRVMVIEVMGRHAGWIALHGGLAGGADIILIPEIPFDHERVAEAVRQRDADGYFSSLIVVAEGAIETLGQARVRAFSSGEYQMGGVGAVVANEVALRTGKEARTCVLGHLQRGGAPTTLDRILGMQFGLQSVELIEAGKFGEMVSYQNSEVGSVSLAAAVRQIKLVSPQSQIVRTCRAMGISFGD